VTDATGRREEDDRLLADRFEASARLVHLFPQLPGADLSERPVVKPVGSHRMTHRDELVYLRSVEASGGSDVGRRDEEDSGKASAPHILRRSQMVIGAVVERHRDPPS
jgi:hypothetical protein